MEKGNVNKGGSMDCCDVLARMLEILKDDLRVRIILELANSDDLLSFRTLARRLHVGHRRLCKDLEELVVMNIVESRQVRTGERKYKFYGLRADVRDLIKCLGRENSRILVNPLASSAWREKS